VLRGLLQGTGGLLAAPRGGEQTPRGFLPALGGLDPTSRDLLQTPRGELQTPGGLDQTSRGLLLALGGLDQTSRVLLQTSRGELQTPGGLEQTPRVFLLAPRGREGAAATELAERAGCTKISHSMETKTQVTLGARLEVLGAAALFSSGGAVIKAIHLAGWQVASFRSAVAAFALFALVREVRRKPTLKVLGVGLAYAATLILFVLANKLTTSASAIYLQSTAPLYVLLLSPWLLREKIRGRDVVFMVVLAAGLGLFFVGTDPVSVTAPNPKLGNLLATASGLTWALTVMGLRALGRSGEAWGPASAFWGNVFAALLCLPLALPLAPARPTDWALIAFLGVFQIAVAYFFLIRGLVRVQAFEASLLLLLEPVLNPIWTWLVHGERPGAWSIAGAAVILAATAVKSGVDARGSSSPVAAG
jgi:drug/metabolite transporter, DME family